MDAYIGQICLFACSYAPRNWAICQGQTLAIAQNQALFAILGTTYGGNGVTTFQLPDLRGATAVSVGQAPGRSNYTLGQVGGAERVTLNQNHLPAHTHVPPTAPTVTLNVSTTRPDQTSPNGTTPTQFDDNPPYSSKKGSTNLSGVSTSISVTPAGSNQPVATMMPYLTLNYCICMSGIFPPRP
jgi:microcystin-dependent protein